MNDPKFLTFPIEFLENAFDDIQKVCDNIFDYAIYVQSLKYEKECDSDIEAIEKAAKFFEIELGNVRYTLNNGYSLYEEYGTKVAKANINKEIIFDYYRNKKTEFEIASFCAYCATKSIIGAKTYCKTNKFLIHARMFGHNKVATMKNNLNKTKLQEKYFKRYNFDKLIKELQHNWDMYMISNRCRGFYISYEIGLEELAIISEKAKQKTKDLMLQKAKEEAIKKAMEIVKKENDEKQAPTIQSEAEIANEKNYKINISDSGSSKSPEKKLINYKGDNPLKFKEDISEEKDNFLGFDEHDEQSDEIDKIPPKKDLSSNFLGYTEPSDNNDDDDFLGLSENNDKRFFDL